jgi:hypothetical protein
MSRADGIERSALGAGSGVLDDRTQRSVVSKVSAGHMEYLMLVDVRQPTKMPKGMRLWRVPSLVRLEVADEAAMVGKQACVPPKLASLTRLPQVSTSVRKDWERDLRCFPLVFWATRWTPGDSELPSVLVEARTEVVGDVAKQTGSTPGACQGL